MAKYNDKGQEIPDPNPVAVPLMYQGGLTMEDRLQAFIRTQLSRHAAAREHETFEEADDFEIEDGDDELLQSPYEVPEGRPELVAGPDADDGQPPRAEPKGKPGKEKPVKTRVEDSPPPEDLTEDEPRST